MVYSRLMKPIEAASPGQTEGRNKKLTLPPREGQAKKQHKAHVSVGSQIESKIMAKSKWRRSLKQTKFGVDLCNTLNAKRNQGGELSAKLDDCKAATISKVAPAGSTILTVHDKQRKATP